MNLRQRIAKKRLSEIQGELVPVSLNGAPAWMTRVYANNHYVVMINDNAQSDKGKCIQCLIQRCDDKPIPNHWVVIQKIKNDVFGEEVTAVEYYPSQSSLVDHHNIYWIWIFPEGVLPIPKAPLK